jgi:hypothetical protein
MEKWGALPAIQSGVPSGVVEALRIVTGTTGILGFAGAFGSGIDFLS